MSYFLALTFSLASTYIIKFKLLGFPTNLLMVWVFLFWAIFFIYMVSKNRLAEFFGSLKNLDKKLLIFTGLFFVSALLALFLGGFDRAKLGQFIVLFLQPIITFFIARFIISTNPNTKNLLLTACYLLFGFAGLLAIIQYFTLFTLPPQFWGNSLEPKRATAFFIHPNFYALWCAPLIAFLIPDLRLRINNFKREIYLILSWVIGAIGLFLSLSRAGWMGLVGAVMVYFVIAADSKTKKFILSAVIVIVIAIIAIPNFRYRLLLPFYGEKSSLSRFSLWEAGVSGIKKNPLFGLGLNGFSNQYSALSPDPQLDTHNFPHNVFLNFWVETGILGLLSFISICYFAIYQGLKNRQDILKLGVTLFIVALLTQGQLDNPYFKNDLAMVFWMILAFV